MCCCIVMIGMWVLAVGMDITVKEVLTDGDDDDVGVSVAVNMDEL